MRDMTQSNKIIRVDIDDESLSASGTHAEHERRVAIFDLLEENYFKVNDVEVGPYGLKLSIVEDRLVLDVSREDGVHVKSIIISLMTMRRVMKDYFSIFQSYQTAIQNGTQQQIEAIDMGRRGLHNEGSELLMQKLKGKADFDFDTARRLFTLVCALHQKGLRL